MSGISHPQSPAPACPRKELKGRYGHHTVLAHGIGILGYVNPGEGHLLFEPFCVSLKIGKKGKLYFQGSPMEMLAPAGRQDMWIDCETAE
jgi:hypothetical protein